MVTDIVQVATMFFLTNFQSPTLRVFPLIYIIFLSHPSPTRGVDYSSGSMSNPPSPEVFRSSGKAEITLFRDHFLINVTRELDAKHSIRW